MERMSGAKKVLLVDDHALMRQGVRSLLDQHSDLCVVGEACDGLEAVHYARTLQPHVIVMDLNMPKMDGVQATRLIKAEHPHMLIIGLSMIEAATMRDALLQAGASGYVNKEQTVQDLYTTICRSLEEASSTW
jgi:DNA-binding NarL/FixJ family response regulator